MTLSEILKQLYAGRKITLSFPTPAVRESFRQKLYKTKQREDRILTDILDEDRKILKYAVEEPTPSATFWLENKPKEQFDVLIMEDC